ncbi:MAG: glycosyltransferase, partial [Nocardioides sp.]|nr:glycosyltransferase [Nocardioides sp.]
PTAYAALGGPGAGRTVLAPQVRFTVPQGLVAGSDAPWTTLPAGARADVEQLLRRIGLDPATYRSVRDPVPQRRVLTQSPPRLRWTLDTAARAGTGGETWGDTHFARSLAAALRRLGQHVAVDPAPARHRWSRGLDDVVVVLRGLDRVQPGPAAVHLLWVISHPDLVDAEEVAAYDGVFAASLSWAAARTREWGLPVEPLLQCTEPALFHPGRAEPDTGADVLFVGNSRGVVRPALAGALAAGAHVSVHGGGWGPVLPDLDVVSRHVDNTELGRLYAGAGVVLNDHWDDMRRDGFVSNRLFDATACAARVVSDDVAGVDLLFGSQVHTFEDPDEVAGLLAGVPADFPSFDERLALAARVAAEHSFEHRAATLLDVAVDRLRR